MAQKTIISLKDDLTGEDADGTITFSWAGVDYEIDLTEAHLDEFTVAMQPWVEAARRVGGRRTPTPSRRTVLPEVKAPITRDDRKAIQEFAKSKKLPVPADRGRIAATVLSAWEQAGKPRPKR